MNYLIQDFAYPNPSSRGGKSGIPIVHLSSKFTKKLVYNEMYLPFNPLNFSGVVYADGNQKLEYNSFAKLWKQKYAHVKIFNPKYDLCNTCCYLRKKKGSESQLYNHYKDAYIQRKSFNNNVELTRSINYITTSVQLTFDYAEKILIPKYVDQQQSIYFKTPLKIDLFGVANNTRGIQSNYVLPEGHWPADKGINSIASMLFHNIKKNFANTNINTIYLMADNCSGQNKNCFMMWFLLYLCAILPTCSTIYLKFLIAGHTKNFCDAAFGLCKRAIKRKDILTPKDVVKAYRESSICNIVELVNEVIFYDWKSFLGQFFDKKVAEMTLQHEFMFVKGNFGSVCYKKFATDSAWNTASLLIANIKIEDIQNAGNSNTIYEPLSKFIINPVTYSLESKRGSSDEVNRKQYLDKDVVEKYLVGDDEQFREAFFGCGL